MNYTLEELSHRLCLSESAVRRRARSLGLDHKYEKIKTNEGFLRKQRLFTKDECERLTVFKNSFISIDNLNAQESVINLFLHSADNRSTTIAAALNLTSKTVNRIIERYLKNENCIIVESKMNKE